MRLRQICHHPARQPGIGAGHRYVDGDRCALGQIRVGVGLLLRLKTLARASRRDLDRHHRLTRLNVTRVRTN